ncbi:hypothetical protein ScPMuIL_007958 [Solemya velum]
MNTLRLSSSHYRSVKKPKMATKSTDNLVNNVGSPESSNVYSECVKKTNWMGQTLYQNPWKTWRNVSIVRFLRYNVWDADHSKIPSQQELDDKLPIVKGDTKKFVEPSSGVKMMWIGHASVLVQFDGLTIITDPVFSEFIVFGTHRRYRSPSCEVKDLPKIDAVLISHNHCDHLDKASVKQLNEKYGDNLKWYAPLGLKSWLNTNGCNNVIQMDWWQEEEFSTEKRTKFCCVPSQHWSKRGPIDDFKTLWCGWALIGPEHSFYFAGDTGYCEVFQQIGRKYGPFTSAAIPIGCYEPRDLMSPQHVDTEEAVKIHKDVKSENSLGIHWVPSSSRTSITWSQGKLCRK